MGRIILRAFLALAILTPTLMLISGCQPQPRPSNLTAGMAKKNIVKGQTTQAEVMEVFGPPDLVTHRDDTQLWTYDKISQDVETSSDWRRTRASNRSTMLIIYFDPNDVVRDYRLSVTKF